MKKIGPPKQFWQPNAFSIIFFPIESHALQHEAVLLMEGAGALAAAGDDGDDIGNALRAGQPLDVHQQQAAHMGMQAIGAPR